MAEEQCRVSAALTPEFNLGLAGNWGSGVIRGNFLIECDPSAVTITKIEIRIETDPSDGGRITLARSTCSKVEVNDQEFTGMLSGIIPKDYTSDTVYLWIKLTYCCGGIEDTLEPTPQVYKFR